MKLFGLIFASLVCLSANAGYETGPIDSVLREPHAGGRPTYGSIDLSKSAAVGTSKLPNANGGTGQDSSAWTGVPSVSSGTWSSNAVVPISLGGTNAATLAAAYNNLTPAINLQTATYAITTTDSVVSFVTGASNMNATLPTAVGVSGKIYTITKSDNGSGVVSILTTSSQTVGGVASGVHKCAMQFDTVIVISDGSNWLVKQSESVSSRYTFVAGGTPFPNSGAQTEMSNTYVTYTKEYDSHSAFSTTTGRFTAPFPGKYTISVSIYTVSATWTSGQFVELSLFKGGSLFFDFCILTQPTGTFAIGATGTQTVTLAAGDNISVALYQNHGTTLALTASATNYNGISIERVGN